MATGPIRPRRRLLPVTHEAPGSVVGSSGGRGNDLAQRGLADLRRLALDPEAMGGGEGDPGSARALDHGPPPPRPAWSRECASAATRSRNCGAPSATAGWPSATSRTCCPAPPRSRGHPGGGGRADRARGGADRAGDEPARDADGARGDAERAGRRGDRADGGGARGRLPARRAAAAGPRLRAVDPQDRRGRGAPLSPLRARAADPSGGRCARDGRGDGGPGARAAAADLAADGVHPPALPALLHRAGRRRPHGGRLRRAAADGPGDDGVLLRRPDRLHPLHRGGGRRGGARPGRALRRDGRGDAARRGARS